MIIQMKSNKKPFLMWDDPGYALITGGSAGLGEDFAHQLAEKGFTPILVARREKKLNKVCAEIRDKFHLAAEYMIADLSIQGDVKKVKDRVSEIENLDILINNAGFSTRGSFLECDLEDHIKMNKVHMMTPLQLTYAGLKAMKKRGRGAIINVSSLSAFARTKSAAVYAATKSYLKIMTEVLDWENKGDNIRFQALCPGFTYTEFHDVGDFEDFNRDKIPKAMWMESETVVRKSLRALKRGKVVYVPGTVNKIVRFMVSLPGIGRLILNQVNKNLDGF